MINNVLIAMGGVGERFKCKEKNLSSKLFFKINDKTLLDHILDNLKDIIDLKTVNLKFLLTNIKQEKDLDEKMKNYSFQYGKVFTNISDNIFSYLIENQSNLLIYGDTYLNVNILGKMKENYLNSGLSQIVVLPTDDGIDNVQFIINNDIIKVKHGIQKYEISQLFLFNKDVSNQILKLSKNHNRFDILYKHIIPNNNIMAIKCFKNEVVNINIESDLRKINIHKKSS